MSVSSYLDYYTQKEIYDMAYYLIMLFYKTDCKYACSRPKINRLLTIYILCNIKNKSNLKDSRFFIEENYMGFDISFIDRDVYFSYNSNSDNKEITESLNENAKISKEYQSHIQKIDIPNSSKELLELIFRKFGNINDIGKKVQELKDFITFDKKYNGTVDIKIEDFFSALNDKKIIKKYKNNEVFKFIREFHNKMEKNHNPQKEEQEKMQVTIYNKLVRDKIPEIIKEKGDIPILRNIYDKRLYKKELMNALLKEYNELNGLNREEYIEVLSNMVEIIRQLAKIEYTSLDYIVALADINTNKYGSFEDKVFLERVLKKENKDCGKM